MHDHINDIEVYPNYFLLGLMDVETQTIKQFEISPFKNEFRHMMAHLSWLRKQLHRMVGFNNYGYDYIVLHELIMKMSSDSSARKITKAAYAKSQSIFAASRDEKFRLTVWDNNQVVPQVDLYKIHHFDNINRATSLKVLEFNMRSENVEELPIPPGTILTFEEMEVIKKYNRVDLRETYKFYLHSLELIGFREKLTARYDRNFINHNDTKIGKDFFVMELQKRLGKSICYYYDENGNIQLNQTKRKQIDIDEIIFPYVKLRRPEFAAVVNWLRRQTIKQTKGVFTEIEPESLGELKNYADLKLKKKKIATLNTIVDGVKYVFGLGGIHASIESSTIHSDQLNCIIDLDVTSYYPSLAIENRIFPEHLTEKFCDIYQDIKSQRAQYDKKNAINAMLKLALNGVFGDSNSRFSPFYDPRYTMSITVNGQLLLCMLAEKLLTIKGLKLIQANTDGVTVILPRRSLVILNRYCTEWELLTGLNLEEAFYETMFIRDVNNYIGVYEDGSVKRKGAYEYGNLYQNEKLKNKVDWYQNHSNIVSKKAASAYLLHGVDVEYYIKNHNDKLDFLLRTKVPRSSGLIGVKGDDEIQLQNVTRYLIVKDGLELIKIMPPLAGKTDKRRISVNKGLQVLACDNLDDLEFSGVDYDFYINEAMKLIEPVEYRSIFDTTKSEAA